MPKIRALATMRVQEILAELPVSSLDDLMRLVAAKLSVRLEFIFEDEDLRLLAKNVFQELQGLLVSEFLDGDTEGLLLRVEERQPGDREYLAVIDARGPRRWRAYFTAWHELTHLLVTPAQVAIPGFRRTPIQAALRKDPIESLVDDVAGRLAFFRPLFEPALQQAVRAEGRFTLAAVEQARLLAAPNASFLATALAALKLVSVPACLVRVDLGLKASEERLASQSVLPGLRSSRPKRQVRLASVARRPSMKNHPLPLFKNMRVPEESVLFKAFEEVAADTYFQAREDLSWWETSEAGSLPARDIDVFALRRGSYVYGLLTLGDSSTTD